MVGGSFANRTVLPNQNSARGVLATPAKGTTELSSAEDMSLLTTAPAASPSEPQREEIPVEPGEADAPPLNPAPSLRTNMVARVVRLLATALPTDKNAIERALVTEETDSVLVHENGGVIRLSAAVAHGQLLLLTNVELKREVIVQVKRKRVHRPTSCFVELEFVEPAPGFWGMEFSAATALLPKAAQDAEAAALVISAEATTDEPGEPQAPTVEEIQAFKREVEVLRGQPAMVPTPPESLQAPAVAPTPAAVPEASVASPVAMLSTEVHAAMGSDQAAGAPSIDNSWPKEHIPEPTQWSPEEQAQLPQPSLDFSMSLPKRKRSLRARGSFTPNFRGGILRLVLLITALVVTAVGAAWFKHWLPWQSRPGAPANANASLPPGSPQASNGHEFNNARVASDAPVTSEGAPSRSVVPPSTVSPESKDAVETFAQPSGSNVSETNPPVRKTSPSASLAGKRPIDRPTPKTVTDSVTPSAAGGILVPPKLIKSVRAVASLDALRDFETGNVVIDAVVGTSGEVNFISVLSGPPSLRPAAVESLKEFQYEPATRNGQPVPSHVTIAIHFRFEP
jgi:hypothetical protein